MGDIGLAQTANASQPPAVPHVFAGVWVAIPTDLIAGQVLNAIQVVQPAYSPTDPCAEGVWGNTFLRPYRSADRCDKDDAIDWRYDPADDPQLDRANRRLTVRERGAGDRPGLELTAQLTLDARHRVVQRVRAGEAADRPDDFPDQVFGGINVYGLEVRMGQWNSPTVTQPAAVSGGRQPSPWWPT
jgi:hypothetical protein